jgi:hypothetical protein
MLSWEPRIGEVCHDSWGASACGCGRCATQKAVLSAAQLGPTRVKWLLPSFSLALRIFVPACKQGRSSLSVHMVRDLCSTLVCQ